MSMQNHARWIELSDGTVTAALTFYEALSFTQSFSTFGGSVTHRMLDGTGVKQTHWSKLRTSASGQGGMPIGVSSLDFSLPITIKCGVERSVSSTSNSISIPSGHRVDTGYLPVGLKLIEGFFVPAPVSIVVSTVTVAFDAAATAYKVMYFPQIETIMDEPSESFDKGSVATSWNFTAEEV